ncbi:MAG: cytochrome c maturation protein CcmE [Thermomicrobiales bacterium]|nr:cytochrome c maturation protein CcmE [Thermomicrobiales bacterium]
MDTTSTAQSTRQRRNPWLNPKLIIVAGVIIAAVGFLVFNAMGSSMAYFKTVAELEQSGELASGATFRVGGNVVAGSIERDIATNELRFTLTDGVNTLPVVYNGVVPDIFTEDVEVVAEGAVGPDGTMQATTLLTKCPSRFEAATHPTS